jgi:hypothetical protein
MVLYCHSEANQENVIRMNENITMLVMAIEVQ